MEIDFTKPPKIKTTEIEKSIQPNPFDLVNNINEKKEYIEDVTLHGGYIPWMINKALSFQPGNIMYSNEMNLYAMELTPQMQYDYFYHILPKAKKWGKWHKFKITEEEEDIMGYYECNWEHAKVILSLLQPEQLKQIRADWKILKQLKR